MAIDPRFPSEEQIPDSPYPLKPTLDDEEPSVPEADADVDPDDDLDGL